MAESVGGKPEERRLLRILPASASQDPSLSNVELKAEEKFVDLKFSAHPSNSSFNLHIYDTDCVTPKDNCVYIAQNRRPNLRFFRKRWTFEVYKDTRIEKGDALTCDWNKVHKQLKMNRTWRAQDFAAYFGEVEYEGMRDYGELSISGDAQDEIETSSGEQDEESAVEHGEESGGAAVGKVDSLYEELRVSEQDRRKRTFMEMVRNAAALSRAE